MDCNRGNLCYWSKNTWCDDMSVEPRESINCWHTCTAIETDHFHGYTEALEQLDFTGIGRWFGQAAN
jgi:hypothetical protein